MRYILLLFLLCLFACGNSQHAGGSSEHENVLTAIVLDSSGHGVAGAMVWLRDSSQSVDSALSDTSGSVHFKGQEETTYWIFARKNRYAAFQKVESTTDAKFVSTLQNTGMLRKCWGSAFRDDSAKILGLSTVMQLDEDGCMQLDSLPAAEYYVVLRGSIQVASLSHGLRIHVPVGTGDSQVVWIPVRLDSSGIDLVDSLGAKGLRVFEVGGVELALQVEDWSTTKNYAMVWIRLPFLATQGTELILTQESSNQYVPDAFADSSDGWFHVWHFVRNDTAEMGNHNSQNGSAPLGDGRLFFNSTQYFQVALGATFASSGNLSAWTRMDSVNANDTSIFVDGVALQVEAIGDTSQSSLSVALRTTAGTAWLHGNVAVANGAWHLWQVNWNANGMAHLFIDGTVQDSVALSGALNGIADSLVVGKFPGALDELRLGIKPLGSLSQQALDYSWQERNSTVIGLDRF